MRKIGLIGGLSGTSLLAAAVGMLGAETLVNGNDVPYRRRNGWRKPRPSKAPKRVNVGRDEKAHLVKGLRP